jgi:hypothetical protein
MLLFFDMSCQHLEFCLTKFDPIYPLAIINYASVKLVGRYLDQKLGFMVLF